MERHQLRRFAVLAEELHFTRAAGDVLFHNTRRVMTVLDQAREEVKAVASGLQGSLHIAVSDHVIDFRLSAFLAHCRAEELETTVAADTPTQATCNTLQIGRAPYSDRCWSM